MRKNPLKNRNPIPADMVVRYTAILRVSRGGVKQYDFVPRLYGKADTDHGPNRAQRRLKQFNRRYALNGTIQRKKH